MKVIKNSGTTLSRRNNHKKRPGMEPMTNRRKAINEDKPLIEDKKRKKQQ